MRGEKIQFKDQIVPFSFNIEFCKWVKFFSFFSSRFACPKWALWLMMAVVGTEGIYRHWEVPVRRNVMHTHDCIICRALGNCWGFASTWEKATPENWETRSSGFICCVFAAGLLLLLRVTYLSSHRLCCSRILCTPPRLLSLHSACSKSWCLEGPAKGKVVWSWLWALRSSKRLPQPQWVSLQGATGKALAHKGMYTSSSRVVVRKNSQLWVQVCTHLPGLVCFSLYSSLATFSSIPFFFLF